MFRWIDMNGAKYGISRPIRHFDPPHVEPRVEWRRLASSLRRERTGAAVSTEVAANQAADDTRPAARRKARNVRVASARGGKPARNSRRAN